MAVERLMRVNRAFPAHPEIELTAGAAALKYKAWLAMARRMPLSFWALFAYTFFEYVRPQTVYPALDVLPYALICLVVASGAATLESTGARRWTVMDAAMLSFTTVLLASLLTAYDRPWGLHLLEVYINWLLVYILFTSILNSQTRLAVFLLGWMLWNLKMSLFAVRSWASIGFAFRDWGVGGAPGWFQNSGEFGIEMCVVFPLSLYFALGMRPTVSTPKFFALLVLPVTAVIGTIASSSRGAQLGVAVVALWMLARSRHKFRAFVSLAVAGSLFFVFIPPEQLDRMSASGSDETSVTRLVYWERGIDIANAHPVLGIGYASWLKYYGDHYEPPVQLPHNFMIEALAELGYTGLAALFFILVSAFVLNFRTRKLARALGQRGYLLLQLGWGLDGAMIGFIVSGFFVTVLYYPFLWVNAALITAVHLTARRTARHFDRLGSRRSGGDARRLNREVQATS